MNTAWRNTIGDVLRRSARRDPNRPALHFESRTWTYRSLDQAASRVAARLLSLGLHKGDRVAAYGKNSDAYLLLFLGCARAGLVHVPVNFALTGEELAYIVNQSGSRAMFHDPSLEDKVTAVRARLGVAHHGTLREDRATTSSPGRRRGRRRSRRWRLARTTSRSCSTPRARRRRRTAPCSPTAPS